MSDTNAKTIDVRLFRFDPDSDTSPRYSGHTISYDEHTTVLDLLETINYTAEPFSFLRDCRMFRCGSCGVKVNGEAMLACHKRVTDIAKSDELVIEPLSSFPHVKDLLVDFSTSMMQRNALRPFPKAGCEGDKTLVLEESDSDVLRQYTACSHCAICVEACASRVNPDWEAAPNPMLLLDIARLARDPRDDSSRVAEAEKYGLNQCDGCLECERVCPMGIEIYELSVVCLRGLQQS